MSVALDVDVAPFLLAANVVFLVLHFAVEYLFDRAENVYRDTSVKKGLSWRGFLNPRSSGRLEELFASFGRIKVVWILIAGLFSLATIGSSFAGEAGLSTRIEDRVRGKIQAHSQFGGAVHKNETECDSPQTCRPLRKYFVSSTRSGDFTPLNFKTSGGQSVGVRLVTNELSLLRSLPRAEPRLVWQNMSASFQACLIFRSVIARGNTAFAELAAESCGSIEEKHHVNIFLAEPEISNFNVYHPDGMNASQWGWFQAIWENTTSVRKTPSVGRVVVFKVAHMDLGFYLQRPLPNICEVADAGRDEEGLAHWVFVCPLTGIDLYVGALHERTTYPQPMLLRAFRVKSNTTKLHLRSEDMTDGMSILSPLFINSGFTGIEGTMFAFRSFVYAVMMSVRASEVRTKKPVVLVVVSIPWLIFSVSLLLIPLIIFVAASYANSLTLSAEARKKDLDIPHSASQVHKAAIRALYPHLNSRRLGLTMITLCTILNPRPRHSLWGGQQTHVL